MTCKEERKTRRLSIAIAILAIFAISGLLLSLIPKYSPISDVDLLEKLELREDVNGVYCEFEIAEVIPANLFGHNLYSGEDTNLSFLVDDAGDLKEGDKVTILISSYGDVLGNFVINGRIVN